RERGGRASSWTSLQRCLTEPEGHASRCNVYGNSRRTSRANLFVCLWASTARLRPRPSAAVASSVSKQHAIQLSEKVIRSLISRNCIGLKLSEASIHSLSPRGLTTRTHHADSPRGLTTRTHHRHQQHERYHENLQAHISRDGFGRLFFRRRRLEYSHG